MHCDSARRSETVIRAPDIQRYRLGLKSNKWYLCELHGVYMTLCYLLSASCVGVGDLIYISYTLFTGGLYVKFFFGYARFGLLEPKGVSVDAHTWSVVSLYHYLRHERRHRSWWSSCFFLYECLLFLIVVSSVSEKEYALDLKKT